MAHLPFFVGPAGLQILNTQTALNTASDWVPTGSFIRTTFTVRWKGGSTAGVITIEASSTSPTGPTNPFTVDTISWSADAHDDMKTYALENYAFMRAKITSAVTNGSVDVFVQGYN